MNKIKQTSSAIVHPNDENMNCLQITAHLTQTLNLYSVQ